MTRLECRWRGKQSKGAFHQIESFLRIIKHTTTSHPCANAVYLLPGRVLLWCTHVRRRPAVLMPGITINSCVLLIVCGMLVSGTWYVGMLVCFV